MSSRYFGQIFAIDSTFFNGPIMCWARMSLSYFHILYLFGAIEANKFILWRIYTHFRFFDDWVARDLHIFQIQVHDPLQQTHFNPSIQWKVISWNVCALTLSEWKSRSVHTNHSSWFVFTVPSGFSMNCHLWIANRFDVRLPKPTDSEKSKEVLWSWQNE